MAREEPPGRRPGGTKGLVVASFVALLALATAAPLSATSNTVIGFDDLGTGTVVTNQYSGQGVEFGHATDFGQPAFASGDCGGPSVGSGTVAANSSPNYAQLGQCNAVGAPPADGTYGAFTGYPRGS